MFMSAASRSVARGQVFGTLAQAVHDELVVLGFAGPPEGLPTVTGERVPEKRDIEWIPCGPF